MTFSSIYSHMNSNNYNKSLIKSIPPAPSFNSAPDIHSAIPIPSFSSAPDFTTSPIIKSKERLDERKESRRETSPGRHRHRRDQTTSGRHRSRSPGHRSRRHRSRSPSHRNGRSSSHSPSYKSSRHRSRSPHSRSSHRHKRSHHRRSKRTPSPEAVHTGTLNTGITFVIDKRGDSDNITYGSNHVYTIPTFKRKGGGRIIGLPPNKRIDHHATSKPGQIKLIDQQRHKGTRYTDNNYAWKELDKSLKRVHIQPQKQSIDPFATNSSMIPLESRRHMSTHDDNDSPYISSGVDYRSLEGNKVKREIVQEENPDEDDEEGESFNDRIRQRTIQYNRQLDQEPTNVKLWLEFIRFQDEAAAGLGTTSSSKKSSLNEVKLSIFEKALEQNPMDESLILAYLKCGAETWETLHLLRQWDKMLKQYPDSIQLWAEYINTRQTNFASFTYSQCVQVFEDALNTLARHIKQRSNEQLEDMEALMVYVLLRACLFMKQAGYQERAFAVMQAIVEYNFFQPSILEGDRKVNAFIDFWDSEVLRFGEEGARGWHEYYRAQDIGEDVEEHPISHTLQEDDDEILTLENWLSSEYKSEQKNRLPFRMSQAEDESVDEDPYRIILSDDIKSFLFNITTHSARQNLIYSIFVFLGLPYMPPSVGTNTHFCTDTFTHNDLALTHFWPEKDNASMKHLVWYVEGVPMNPEQATAQNKPYFIPNSYPVGLSELFAKFGEWFKCSGKEFIHCDVDEQFARNVFRQLLTVDRSEHLTICYLAFESSCGHRLGRKLAKSLLKDQRTCLTLWNAYAQMEKSHGRVDEARKVYLTALSMYRTFPEKEQLSAPLLYYMFAKLEMDNNKPNEALKILVSMSGTLPYDDKTPSPTTPSILRTREHFSQKLAQLSTLSDSRTERESALHTIGCCALFEYLSSGIDSACLVYERAIDYIQSRQAERGYESEMIWTDYASLLYRDASSTMNSGYKPGMLRQTMERALALFPNNTMFLSFYIWNESKTKIYNRVQHLLNNTLNKDSNVVLWLSAIYSELHRYKPFQVNSVRDFFERSIQDTRTRSSIILWKCYIQFEISQNNLDRARNLFYRSIRECPWSKELYLLGIETLSKTMNEKEANELVSLMMEKEIRLRIPIENDLLA